MKRVKGVEDPNMIRAQGIVGVGANTLAAHDRLRRPAETGLCGGGGADLASSGGRI